uniref:Jacalin-type lectin domain-containing protein n=1 Tax=Hordeum vulgare subsp. vulgare TaxID=112509 RepID=A0A8I6XWM5_HORVV
MSKPVKIGLWGGVGGQPRDVKHAPHRLARVEISGADAIHSIKFTYEDHAGDQHVEGAWGAPSGNKHTLDLEDTEYVTEISGTYGRWGSVSSIVTSLKFVTNNGQTIECGSAGSGGSFHVPVTHGGQITGFFGRVGDLIDAIGIYVLP